MASYGSGKFTRAQETGAVAVQGFAGLQRALRAMEDGVQAQVRARLRTIGEKVKETAISNVTHTTGRDVGKPSIEAGMKVSVTVRGASVYTLAPHGGAQNVGAWMKGARGPHITRANASHYMDRAVTSSEAFVLAETEAVLDWLMTTFMEG